MTAQGMIDFYTNRVFDGPMACWVNSLDISCVCMYSSVVERQAFLISDPKWQVTHHPLQAQNLRFYVFEEQPFLK